MPIGIRPAVPRRLTNRSGSRPTVGTFLPMEQSPEPGHRVEPAVDLEPVEEWFVERGVPHLVETEHDGSILDTWTRSLPLLVVAYLLLGLNALDLQNWTTAQNVGAAAAVLVILLATWALSNRLRGVDTFARPTDIDPPELALFLVGPTIPVLVFGQVGDALETLATGVVLLAVVYVWSSFGMSALVRWGLKRSGGQLTGLGPLVARALPLLLLFNTFLFVNAEVWEVAGTLDGAAYAVVVLTFFVLGAGFAASRVPGFIRDQSHFAGWDEVSSATTGTPAERLPLPDGTPSPDPLLRRQRLNVGLIVLFGQALQITLVVAALVGFFVFFGFMAITPTTISSWTGLDELRVLAEASFGGRDLVLSESLVRVSVFLGAFSGMYFTVVLTTDDTYRAEFAGDVGPEIHQVLAVRSAYRIARGTHPDTDPDIRPSPDRRS